MLDSAQHCSAFGFQWWQKFMNLHCRDLEDVPSAKVYPFEYTMTPISINAAYTHSTALRTAKSKIEWECEYS